MARLALLEDFDPPPDPVDSGPGEDWLAGHTAGFAEGIAAGRAEQGALRAEAAQALADLALTFREAETHVLARLDPLFRAIADRIVPGILHETLGIRLIDALNDAARDDVRTPVVLRASPGDITAITAALDLLPGGYVPLPDPHLSPGQVLIDGDATGTCFDFNRLTTDLAAVMAALRVGPPRKDRHG